KLAAFKSALTQTQTLAVAATLLSMEQERHQKEEPRYEPIFSAEELADAIAAWIGLLKERAADVTLMLADTELASNLFRWRDFNTIAEPREWASKTAENPEHVVALLRRFMSVGNRQTVGDFVSTMHESFRMQYFDDLLPVETVLASIAK